MSINGIPSGEVESTLQRTQHAAEIKQQTHKVETKPVVNEQATQEARAAIERLISNSQTSLQISTHPETGDIIIRIQDANTGEVIREIPSQELLDRMAYLLKCAGLLMDKAA